HGQRRIQDPKPHKAASDVAVLSETTNRQLLRLSILNPPQSETETLLPFGDDAKYQMYDGLLNSYFEPAIFPRTTAYLRSLLRGTVFNEIAPAIEDKAEKSMSVPLTNVACHSGPSTCPSMVDVASRPVPDEKIPLLSPPPALLSPLPPVTVFQLHHRFSVTTFP
ncbi:hypothetical protein V494_07924, partial [Pseudogymnoascus sp. VKM F-4513 (FW-928)]